VTAHCTLRSRGLRCWTQRCCVVVGWMTSLAASDFAQVSMDSKSDTTHPKELVVAQELASPYIKKAYDKDGRKELAEMASEKVIKPTKELAAPYVAPYIAKLESTRAEIVASKRFAKAVTALQAAREHPVETACELKSQAIDLLKYENLASYREYIQSEEFQADTRRLVQVELPTIASDAASHGLERVKLGALSLAAEIEVKYSQVTTIIKRGYGGVKKIEIDDLRTRARSLLSELQAEVASGAQHMKAEGFSLSETVSRLKRVVTAIDTILISPVFVKMLDAQAPIIVEGDAPADATLTEVTAPMAADINMETDPMVVNEAPDGEDVEVDEAADDSASVDDVASVESSGVTTDFNKAMDVLGPI